MAMTMGEQRAIYLDAAIVAVMDGREGEFASILAGVKLPPREDQRHP